MASGPLGFVDVTHKTMCSAATEHQHRKEVNEIYSKFNRVIDIIQSNHRTLLVRQLEVFARIWLYVKDPPHLDCALDIPRESNAARVTIKTNI